MNSKKKVLVAVINYVREKCESCENDFKPGNSHIMYKKVKEFATKTSAATTSILERDGSTLGETEAFKERPKTIFKKIESDSYVQHYCTIPFVKHL